MFMRRKSAEKTGGFSVAEYHRYYTRSRARAQCARPEHRWKAAKLDFAGWLPIITETAPCGASAAEAPYLVAGVLQVNAEVPATASSAANSITVQVGNSISQNGVTVWVQLGAIRLPATVRLPRHPEDQLGGDGVAGGIGGGQFELGALPRRDLNAMAERGVDVGRRRIQAQRGGAEDAVADAGSFAAVNRSWDGVEIADLQTAAAERIDRLAIALLFRSRACHGRVTPPLPTAVEDPAIICHRRQQQNAEQRQQAAERAGHFSTA